MVVQYKTGTRYLCNALRQQYGVPVCQYLPADPIDDYVVQAFFAALSPVELDAYHHAMAAEQQAARALDQARRQQLERLRYQAALAERQFNQVDPDNRLVAIELERRWEAALRKLQQAETAGLQAPLAPDSAQALPPELERAFTAIGQKLPELWSTPLLSQAQKKALLRCLIDKVVVHRHRRDRVHTRIVWKGGETTTVDLPIPVGSLAELGNAAALEGRILALARQGLDDAAIAEQLTAAGLRSPMNPAAVLPNTVHCIRLKHQVLRDPTSPIRARFPVALRHPTGSRLGLLGSLALRPNSQWHHRDRAGSGHRRVSVSGPPAHAAPLRPASGRRAGYTAL